MQYISGRSNMANYSVKDAGNLLEGRKIALDPGHGGEESGGLAGEPGVTEKGVNLAVASELKKLLQSAGAEVLLTREDDSTLSLADRVGISVAGGAEVFLSIHHNATAWGDKEVNRSEAYYQVGNSGTPSQTLAELLVEEMERALGLGKRVLPSYSYGVTRENPLIAVIGEASHISNPQEAIRLRDQERIALEAASYFNALVRLYEAQPVVVKWSSNGPADFPLPIVDATAASLEGTINGEYADLLSAWINDQPVSIESDGEGKIRIALDDIAVGLHSIRLTSQSAAGVHVVGGITHFVYGGAPMVCADETGKSASPQAFSKVEFKRVLLDPGGRYPNEGDADRAYSEFNSKVALRLAGMLEKIGVQVDTTRGMDETVSLPERVGKAWRFRPHATIIIARDRNVCPQATIPGSSRAYARWAEGSKLAASMARWCHLTMGSAGAEALLGSDWLGMHGSPDYASCRVSAGCWDESACGVKEIEREALALLLGIVDYFCGQKSQK
jgi:N-acetylmuramoyl-L-alanine amidase